MYSPFSGPASLQINHLLVTSLQPGNDCEISLVTSQDLSTHLVGPAAIQPLPLAAAERHLNIERKKPQTESIYMT